MKRVMLWHNVNDLMIKKILLFLAPFKEQGMGSTIVFFIKTQIQGA